MSDAQIFGDSELFNGLEEETLGLPAACPLTASPDDNHDMPFFILGDDAFALRKYLMKPYGRRGMSRDERIFDYRLSRGRRVVENAFGILANRFRCLLGTLEQTPNNVRDIAEGAVVLHNLLRMRQAGAGQDVDIDDENYNVLPGAWREQVDWVDVTQPTAARNSATTEAKHQRTLLKDFFNSPQGAVAWQERMAGLPDM